MKVISYNSRILNPQEQKLSTLDRKLFGNVYALQNYEFIIIGFPPPIHIFADRTHLCKRKKENTHLTKKEILVLDFTELKCN